MTNKKEKVVVNIESLDNLNEPEELERLSHNLRNELNELDVIEKVDLITKEGEQAPKGSKSGGDLTVLGSTCNIRWFISKQCDSKSCEHPSIMG